MYAPQTTKNKSSFIKVYGELLLFSFLPGLHIKMIFFILGVAILLLVVIALYLDLGISLTVKAAFPTSRRGRQNWRDGSSRLFAFLL